MVLGVGFLLLVSLVLSAFLSGMGGALATVLPGDGWMLQLANQALSFLVITLLFAMMFKVLPDVEIAWKDVWVGAALTTILFSIGKFAIGKYLAYAGVSSSYGAAGSLVVLVLWIYYSSQILLLGAEFTQVYAKISGSPITPAPYAERIPDDPGHLQRS